MKILTLNKTQRKKLLGLCEEFFPEYSEVEFNYPPDSIVMYNYKKGCDYNPMDGRNPYKKHVGIHWYQLCLTELPKRIWDKIKHNDEIYVDAYLNDRALDIQVHMVRSESHPVNYLWNFVQECKKNKYFKHEQNKKGLKKL